MAANQGSAPDLSRLRLAAMLLEHVPLVAALNARLQSYPWQEEHWRSCMLPGYHNWVLLNPEPVAYLSLFPTGDSADLLNIGVAPEWQQCGLGRKLLSTGIALLPPETKRIFLEVRQSNLPARRLYESMGFLQVGERRDYYPLAGSQRETALVYRCDRGNRTASTTN